MYRPQFVAGCQTFRLPYQLGLPVSMTFLHSIVCIDFSATTKRGRLPNIPTAISMNSLDHSICHRLLALAFSNYDCTKYVINKKREIVTLSTNIKFQNRNLNGEIQCGLTTHCGGVMTSQWLRSIFDCYVDHFPIVMIGKLC